MTLVQTLISKKENLAWAFALLSFLVFLSDPISFQLR